MLKRGLDQRRRRALLLAWWHYRRPVLLLVTVLAVLVGYRIAAPGGPRLVPVPVASKDLAAGAVLAPGDVRTVPWPASAAPAGLLDSAAGRTLAGPLRAGEAITDTRVVGRSLLAGQPAGVVAVAVRLADAAGSSIVRPGDRVDVLAAGSGGSGGSISGGSAAGSGGSAGLGSAGQSGAADRVATAALVLSSPASSAGAGSETGEGGLGLLGAGGSTAGDAAPVLVLAVDPGAAGRLASAQGDRLLSVVLLPGA